MNTNPGVVLLLSVLPGIAWVWFFYRQDKYEPEPKALIVKCFLFGALAVFPAGAIEAPFRLMLEGRGGPWALALVTFGVVGLAEEALKVVAARAVVERHEAFNEVLDGVIYCVSAALGFATVENILYMNVLGWDVGAVRAILTNLAHACFSGIAGYYVGLARMGAPHPRRVVAVGIIVAALIHGAYDFVVIGHVIPGYVGVGIVLLAYVRLRQLIASALRGSPFRSGTPG